MNICLENVDLKSDSGPNSFANKLVKYLSKDGHIITDLDKADTRLCFIQANHKSTTVPLFQRLDGIYFNTDQDYEQQNYNIQKTYNQAHGVIFQSEFNKRLTYEYFGPHEYTAVIHNGADIELIDNILPLKHAKLDEYNNIWSCASSWRPHKRLSDNIRYFLEHSKEDECLVVAGDCDQKVKDDRIFYVGHASQEQLISLYKASKYFIHLAWLDHCPNVVVDARASGCQVICSSTGGTKEIAGPNAIVIEEKEWDYRPIKLYTPPAINFEKKINNLCDMSYNMGNVVEKYVNFMKNV